MKVLVSGYLGFGNLGDEALFAGMARALQGRGHEVAALSADPAATRAAHGVAAHPRLHGVPWALARCDVLISGGGGLLQDGTSTRSLSYYLGLIQLARRLRRRVIVFGQSVGPLSARGAERVGRALRGLPVAVRDRPSLAALRALGVPAHLAADPALTLPPPTERPGSGLLLIPRAGVAGTEAALAAVARDALRAGERVRVLAMQPGPDQAAAARLLDHAPGTEAVTADGPAEALDRCADAAFVVSVRLHGLILATVAGRGHAGVVYDPKVDGFLADSGAPGVAVPVDADALRAVVRARQPLARERREALLRRAAHGLDWLDAALRRAPMPNADLISDR